MNDITTDMTKFGYRELDMAGDLLKAFKGENDKSKWMEDGVQVWFNPNSGNVFLCDEDYNTAMMNGDNLEDWFSCPECGHEGFAEDMMHGEDNAECQLYLKDMGIIKTKD